jgi:hypothetical protein
MRVIALEAAEMCSKPYILALGESSFRGPVTLVTHAVIYKVFRPAQKRLPITMQKKEKQPAPAVPTCNFLCVMCEIGAHEHCQDRQKCECQHPTWDKVKRKPQKD